MNTYKYLIFDVDDTIYDFDSAFINAQKNVATLLGVDYSEEYKEIDEKTAWKAWEEMHLDDTDIEDVQKNYHQYYREYIKRHFKYLLSELNAEVELVQVVKCYENSIAESSEFIEESTLSVICELANSYKIVLATNGMENIQEKRIEKLKPYVHSYFISEAMGAIKPTLDYYRMIMEKLNCNPKECLMIGDSITNDIIGAKSIGMDVCFFNPNGKNINSNIVCEYNIKSINDLKEILSL